MQVIMVSGKSCSGKDTVAKRLQEQLEAKGATVLIIHFGDPVNGLQEIFIIGMEKKMRLDAVCFSI